MTEKDITKQIVKYVNSQPFSYAVKYFSSVTGGKNLPDLLGGYHGKPFWIEVKLPGKSARPGQVIAADVLRNAGFVTGTVSSLSEFRSLFHDTV